MVSRGQTAPAAPPTMAYHTITTNFVDQIFDRYLRYAPGIERISDDGWDRAWDGIYDHCISYGPRSGVEHARWLADQLKD
jgi:hypothetical protein